MASPSDVAKPWLDATNSVSWLLQFVLVQKIKLRDSV